MTGRTGVTQLVASPTLKGTKEKGRHVVVVLLLITAAWTVTGLSGAAIAAGSGDHYTWADVGPDGGLITALAIDPTAPTTIYAGAYEGGCTRARTGARRSVPSTMASLRISTLARWPLTRKLPPPSTWAPKTKVCSRAPTEVRPGARVSPEDRRRCTPLRTVTGCSRS